MVRVGPLRSVTCRRRCSTAYSTRISGGFGSRNQESSSGHIDSSQVKSQPASSIWMLLRSLPRTLSALKMSIR